MRRCLVCLLFFSAQIFAAGRSLELSAAYSAANAVATFPDPLYVGEHDYVSAAAQQVRLMAELKNILPAPFKIAYQGLSVKPADRSAQGYSYPRPGYYSSFLHASTAIDTGFVRWHFGLSALITFSTRSHYAGSDAAIDTSLSQAYPSGGFTLFPKAPVRVSVVFLDGDAHLLYGWLRFQVEFESGRHTFYPSVEFLNHASFGKGFPSFVQPPGAVMLGYRINLERVKLFSRLGFVLNSTQGFNSARVGFTDRLIFEIGAAYNFLL